MIVYPLDNYNTFIDVADATAKLTELGSGDKWGALSDTEREVLLSKSTMIIKSVCNLSDSCPLADAQVLLVQADLENNGKYLTSETTEQQYTSAKVGSLKVEYNINENNEVELPSIVTSMLSKCLKSSNAPKTVGFYV